MLCSTRHLSSFLSPKKPKNAHAALVPAPNPKNIRLFIEKSFGKL
jgi:hypothetical protein